ncbi:Predicted regulator of the ubiquitin pathway (contains UAS and UBX domains) [Phaffia rhodozyma]|uniref:Predicted regulator of the ubiquitin pathway (Contains UAS and UBX domains) n=1 Tax=Phaffia rhodozyma TaxID=264483 RepID=A0A0F7SVK3_PHARH|nr:Predicted regulator of the ubiquitin pathway (contains UAS and UBX domains) [Phaffia rhodozyma]
MSSSNQDAYDQLHAITCSSSPADIDRDRRILRETNYNVQASFIINRYECRALPVLTAFSISPCDVPSSSREAPSASSSLSARAGSYPPFRNDNPTDQLASSSSTRNDGQPQPHSTEEGIRPLAGLRVPRGLRGITRVGVGLGWTVYSIVLWPVGIVWSVLVARFLPSAFLSMLPLAFLPSVDQFRANPSTLPRGPASLRFLRSLEQLTRARSPSSLQYPSSDHDGDEVKDDSMSAEEDEKDAQAELPEFFIGKYKDALEKAKKEGRIALVGLFSSQHEKDEDFKKTVLTDPALVDTLKRHNIIFWAGDVSDKEPYQVTRLLPPTTYPSLTFISLLPPARTRASAPSSPPLKLTVLSRLEGPSTTASDLINTIEQSILPRVSATLNRIHREIRLREEELSLREMQDRAFKEAEVKDLQRILAVRREREEKEERERERLRKETAKEEETRRRIAYLRYARRSLVPLAEPDQDSIGITLRVPPNQRPFKRSFPKSASMETLYLWADTLTLPAELDPADDPAEFDIETYAHQWSFKLATAYPRKVVSLDEADGTVGASQILKNGAGVLVLERIGETGRKAGGDDADGDEKDQDSDCDESEEDDEMEEDDDE